MEYMEQQMQNHIEAGSQSQKEALKIADEKNLHIHVLDKDDCSDVYSSLAKYMGIPDALAFRFANHTHYIMHGENVVSITHEAGVVNFIHSFKAGKQS